jgi:nucleoid-associated protein YgaU
MPRVHKVDHGDTLFGIAQKFYGDGMKFPIIAQANGIRDPEEYELLPPDPPPSEQMPSTAERLVYADHFPL